MNETRIPNSGLRNCSLARLISALLRCIPPLLAWRVGGGIGAVIGSLPIREVRRSREHLAKAFPERDHAWVVRTARRTFVHFTRMALWTAVTLHWDIRKLRRNIAVEGQENFRALLAACKRGEGTVGFTGHFGNWELLSRVGATIMPLSLVGRRLRSPLADALVQGARTSSGGRLIYQDAPFADFVRDLREGRLLAVLVDQDISRLAGCFVPWFGDLAYTPNAPAALARLTRSGVMPVFLYWKERRWVLHAGPHRYFPRTRDSEGDVRAIIEWVTAYEEAIVRRAPEQWVWWHKRWRTRPSANAESRMQNAE
jgi:Kdo2-lipid IVA lauroyltransferase/acyltransferase